LFEPVPCGQLRRRSDARTGALGDFLEAKSANIIAAVEGMRVKSRERDSRSTGIRSARRVLAVK
jgi:hypothetical protein